MTSPPPIPSTTPPQAKVVTATGAAVSTVIAQLTELAVVGGAVWLRHGGHLSEDHLMYVVLAAIVGPGVAKIRGLPGASSLVTLGVALPWIIKKSALS